MKKIVRGKINTLQKDDTKVVEVVGAVLDAIRAADDDDKTALAAEGASANPEVGMGKKYLLDLLASNAIVRVQTEGFSG